MSDFFFLPEALMLNMWLNLSIKSTVRFRCVSKSWCAALSDPHFIYKNLIFSEAAANEDDLLLLVNHESPHYSVVSHETLRATPLQVPPEVPVPYMTTDPHMLTPPLDDLVCFYDSYSIGVWNLRTGETAVYADADDEHTEDSGWRIINLGFGFDEKTKGYKIVEILYDHEHFVAYVYSLGSPNTGPNNGWRKVGEPNMCYSDGIMLTLYSRTYRDGTFYWGATNMIVSFDMSTEVFNFISIPILVRGPSSSSHIQEIIKLKEGSMFIIICNWNTKNWRRLEYEIWALLELGVTQTWTKLLAIDWSCGRNVPLGLWRNEWILQPNLAEGPLLIKDPFKLETKEVQLDEPHHILRCILWEKGKRTSTSIV